jgi:nicotinamide-nucleotide amidase
MNKGITKSSRAAPAARLATQLGAVLLHRGQRVTTAESCTGGWIAKTLTDVAGSSQWFESGYITYSNAAKQKMLNVSAATLRRHGAVSEAVVRAMARGALRASGADVAVAVSGIAGPGGGSPGKPVGMVWIAWAIRRGGGVRLRAECYRFRGTREAVRSRSVVAALRGLRHVLKD